MARTIIKSERKEVAEQMLELLARLEAGQVEKLIVSAEFTDGDAMTLYAFPGERPAPEPSVWPGDWN